MATSSSELQAKSGWLGRALIYALIYLAIGVLFAALAARAGLPGARIWRFGAWVASAIAFGTHIQWERVTLARSIMVAAWHAAFAVALGAVALAVSAIVHRHLAGTRPSGLLFASLVLWPALTFIPAFAVAAAAGSLMHPRGATA